MGNISVTHAILNHTLAPYPIQITLFFMFLFKFRYSVIRSAERRRVRVTIRRIRRIHRRLTRFFLKGARRTPLLFRRLIAVPQNRIHYNVVRMLC